MSEEVCQQDLANVIKGTHAELRLKVQKVIECPKEMSDCSNEMSDIERVEDDIWTKHAEHVMSSDQRSYAKAMGTLAKGVWERDKSTKDNSQSRIDWIKRHLDKYFYENDHLRFEERMNRKLMYLKDAEKDQQDVMEEKIDFGFDEKVSVLDVGSCYNPFGKFSSYQVVAIDLSPSPENNEVFQCDFVNVNLSDKSSTKSRLVFDENRRVESISSDSFDSVVFCLLLEYLPLARLRHKVCGKAFRVLKNRGILVIVTPDSSHQGKNLDQVLDNI